MTAISPTLRVLVFGTADVTKPRVRLLLEGLRLEGHEMIDCTHNIWASIADKSQVRSKLSMIGLALNWLWQILRLSVRYLFAPKHDVVLVCYPGHLDLWFIRPLSYLRRAPVVWDVFLSAYDTIVLDRRMASPGSPTGRLVYMLDWCACRLCDHLFLDTKAHAHFFENTFGLPKGSVGAVPVGAEASFLTSRRGRSSRTNPHTFTVLFYGQLIPLHGIETILEAGSQLEGEDIAITVIGRGQHSSLVNAWTAAHPGSVIEYVEWVPYDELPSVIAQHDICLGIFSAGDKADRVVPNKVYQVLGLRKPLITRRSQAMTDFLHRGETGIWLVLPGDAEALATAIRGARKMWQAGELPRPSSAYVIGAGDVGNALTRELGSNAKR